MLGGTLPKWHGATSTRVARDVGFNGGFTAFGHTRRQHEGEVVRVRHNKIPRGSRGDGQAAGGSNMRRERLEGLHARERQPVLVECGARVRGVIIELPICFSSLH